jgi:hypothetical protein
MASGLNNGDGDDGPQGSRAAGFRRKDVPSGRCRQLRDLRVPQLDFPTGLAA